MNNNYANLQEEEFNKKLNSNDPRDEAFKMEMNLSIEDVRRLAILKFNSVGGFARKLGVTASLGSRLLSGDYVPLKIDSIQKIANALEISPIALTRIYDSLKDKKKQAKCNKFDEVKNE